ncbi:MAG: S1C family serine protease [Microthrixaceae bacterium]
MDNRGWVGVGLVVAVMVAGGCASGADAGRKGTDTACPGAGGDRPAKAILACTEPAIAYVETEIATGTGVLVESGSDLYILTNAHVVDPFTAADVRLDGRSHDDVAVVGVDLGADVAVLGPVTGSLPAPLEIADGNGLERGDDVFLVGFPGESQPDDLEATIASGIVSRTRALKEFGQTYIQTDASIGGGQSGGPMFDSSGRFVGVSGLSFADNFALALTGADVRDAVERILSKGGDVGAALPATDAGGGGSTSGSVHLSDASDAQVLFLPARDKETTWNLSVDMSASPIIWAEAFLDAEPVAQSSNYSVIEQQLFRELASARGGRPDELPDPGAAGVDPAVAAAETSPGTFSIPVEADRSLLVFIVAPLTDRPVDVAWTSDLPLFPASQPVREVSMEVGGKTDHILWALDTAVDVLIDLESGQEVELYARSPQGDVGFTVFGPSLSLDHLTSADPEGAGALYVDDTDDGLFGVDARELYVAEATGTHRIRLFINDDVGVFLRFSVLDCATTSCEKSGGASS